MQYKFNTYLVIIAFSDLIYLTLLSDDIAVLFR
jgi:hypothetical protein